VASSVILGDAQTYTLTGADNGENGLPIVATDITVLGNGSTISRSSADRFRLFEVAGTGALTLDKVTVTGGLGTLSPLVNRTGGGILVAAGGALELINSRVIGNATGDGAAGGGISSAGTLILTNSTVSGNSTGAVVSGNGPGGNGGGIYVTGTGSLTLTSSTISGNVSSNGGEGGGFSVGGDGGSGGGLFIDSGLTTAAITNSTIADNIAGNGGDGFSDGDGGSGGGIRNLSAVLSLTNVTLKGNRRGTGSPSGTGGNISTAGAILAKNTIVSAPGAGANCAGTGFNGNSATNLASDATCTPGFTQQTAVQINLGSLADNGGPAQTMALLSPSSAIDAGDVDTCAGAPVSGRDQRGYVRPLNGDGAGGAACDIGAFEACPASNDCDGDGYVDTDEAVIGTNAGYPCGGTGWPSDLWVQDASANTLDIQDILSFIAPTRLLDTSPGQGSLYDPRWDLAPGPNTPFTDHINIVDITTIFVGDAGSPAYPPMFGGARALGLACPVP
jgi:hypothetical protein